MMSSYRSSQSNLSLPMDEPFQPPDRRNHRMSMPVGSISSASGSFTESPKLLHRPRSRSPLRHSTSYEGQQSADGSPRPVHDEDDPWGRETPQSPTLNTAARFASQLANRVGSLISVPRSPSLMPTDAELEAEAAAERDRSRREAERIMRSEAEERRRVEQGIEAAQNMLPPPSPGGRTRGRSPSPAGSTKEGGGGWWKKLAGSKDKDKDLTPSQQIAYESKQRSRDPSGERERERPRSRAMSTPSVTPLAFKQNSLPGGSPARDAPPLYATFRSDGALDIQSTLMTLVRRFEKLERWSVGHVRALEERVNDVEKWLVDKEREDGKLKEGSGRISPSTLFEHATVAKDVEELKDDVGELKGRITELGKEMVLMRRGATSRPLPSPGPGPVSAPIPAPVRAPAPTPAPAPTFVPAPASIPQPQTATLVSPTRVTSPPLVGLGLGSTFSSGSITSASSRTRGNFPVGDYKSSGSSVISPPTSPPSRSPSALPATQALRTPSPLPPTNDRSVSPTAAPRTPQATTSSGLPAPPSQRVPSVSPPRKRYTVALGGGSISEQRDKLQTAYFEPEEPAPADKTAYPAADKDDEVLGDGVDLERTDSKIGRTAINLSRLSLSPQPEPESVTPAPMPGRSRARPQSAVYGPGASPTPQFRERERTMSTAAGGSGTNGNGSGSGGSYSSRPPHRRAQSIDPTPKFVDPLVIKRKESGGIASPRPGQPKAKGKLAVGQLVAFFDGDNKA